MFAVCIDYRTEVVKTYLEDPYTDPQNQPAISQTLERLTLTGQWWQMTNGNYNLNTKRPLASRSDTDVTVSKSTKEFPFILSSIGFEMGFNPYVTVAILASTK